MRLIGLFAIGFGLNSMRLIGLFAIGFGLNSMRLIGLFAIGSSLLARPGGTPLLSTLEVPAKVQMWACGTNSRAMYSGRRPLLKIVAQNSCNKEAILEFDDFWLGTHCFVAQNHSWLRQYKVVVERFVVQIRLSKGRYLFVAANNPDWRQVRSDDTAKHGAQRRVYLD